MGERLHGMQEVIGSSPLSSTLIGISPLTKLSKGFFVSGWKNLAAQPAFVDQALRFVDQPLRFLQVARCFIHAHLLAMFQLCLKTNHIIERAKRIILPQLDNRIWAATGARIVVCATAAAGQAMSTASAAIECAEVPSMESTRVDMGSSRGAPRA